MTWTKVFLIVTAGAIAGMSMGGAFGFAAGTMAPGFFRNIIPWTDAEPRGVATLFGATAGVLLGGALAVFAIAVQALTRRPAFALRATAGKQQAGEVSD